MVDKVEATAVLEIFKTDMREDQITPFIDMAHSLVDEELAGKGLSDTRLDLIQKNLAAHFAKMYDPEMQSEQIEDYRYKVAGERGEGLMATSHGQTAVMLDTTGTLAQLNADEDTYEADFGVISTVDVND